VKGAEVACLAHENSIDARMLECLTGKAPPVEDTVEASPPQGWPTIADERKVGEENGSEDATRVIHRFYPSLNERLSPPPDRDETYPSRTLDRLGLSASRDLFMMKELTLESRIS
jgi:hypothetical protein